MTKLKGTLGERQKQLNMIVKQAAVRYNSVKILKKMSGTTDINMFIKIDLASTHLRLDYLIEVLKGGDSLYITRVLKCLWIYKVEYSKQINAEFVKENIFPFMSVKMRRKMLTFMSIYMKDAKRSAEFVEYCMDIHLPKLAFKFAAHAPEENKIIFLTKNSDIIESIISFQHLQRFIGKSFELAAKLLRSIKIEPNKFKVLYNISHLYWVDNSKYLDLVENHVKYTPFSNLSRLNRKITKHLLSDENANKENKNKERVLARPRIYINFLHSKTVVNCVTPNEAKVIVTELHPETVEQYWNECFCTFYESFINKIPYAHRYQYLKSTFFSKYKCEIFENFEQFNSQQCFKLMTKDEKLELIENQITNHPELKRYSFYNILDFDTAFEKIIDLVRNCDSSEMRCDMMLFILPTVKSQFDIKRLLDYYRDSKEPEHVQQDFINRLLRDHKAYYFNKNCWIILNEIFIKLKVYDFRFYNNVLVENFRTITILYYIINENNLSEELKSYMSVNEYLNPLLALSRKTPLTDQQKIYEYLFDYYKEKISEFDTKQEVPQSLRKYVTEILDLMSFYGKTKGDIPDVVMNVVNNFKDFQTHEIMHVASDKITQNEIMKLLKVDPKMVIDKLPLIIKTQEISPTFRVNQLFKKLKIYFSNDTHDIAYQCFKFYENWLSKNSLSKTCTKAAIYAIFLLGNDAFKVHFMTTHAPIDDEKSKKDPKKLRIQDAIVSTVCQSRPPVPIKHVMMYVLRPLHIISSFLVNLPFPLCMEFLSEMMQMRPLVQERSIQFAFKCFNTDQLRKVILYIWNKKNPSVRLMVYKTLYDKIPTEKTFARCILFKHLIALTARLNENDKDIFEMVVSQPLPEQLVSEFIITAWKAVNSLPKNNVNLKRRSDVIDYMNKYYYLLEVLHIRPIIEDFVQDLLDMDKDYLNPEKTIYHPLFILYDKKLELIGKYLTCASNTGDYESKKEITETIINECITQYSYIDENGNGYVGREVLIKLIKFMQEGSYTHHYLYVASTNDIFKMIIEMLSKAVPMEEIYFTIWDIHMDIAVRNALIDINQNYNEKPNLTEKASELREILLNIGEYIGDVINILLKKNKFITNLTSIVVDKSYTHVMKIVQATKVEMNDVSVVIGLALLKFDTPEHYMTALILLPDTYTGLYPADYTEVIKKMFISKHKDVTALTFEKFINSNWNKKNTSDLLKSLSKDVQRS